MRNVKVERHNREYLGKQIQNTCRYIKGTDKVMFLVHDIDGNADRFAVVYDMKTGLVDRYDRVTEDATVGSLEGWKKIQKTKGQSTKRARVDGYTFLHFYRDKAKHLVALYSNEGTSIKDNSIAMHMGIHVIAAAVGEWHKQVQESLAEFPERGEWCCLTPLADGDVVNHKDGCTLHNNMDNCESCLTVENIRHGNVTNSIFRTPELSDLYYKVSNAKYEYNCLKQGISAKWVVEYSDMDEEFAKEVKSCRVGLKTTIRKLGESNYLEQPRFKPMSYTTLVRFINWLYDTGRWTGENRFKGVDIVDSKVVNKVQDRVSRVNPIVANRATKRVVCNNEVELDESSKKVLSLIDMLGLKVGKVN